MCSHLHRAPHGTYYFRITVPAELRPFLGGKREIKKSLRLKDREAAKLLIPDHTKAAHSLFAQAQRDRNAANAPAPKSLSPKSRDQRDREQAHWEGEQEQFELQAQAADDLDSELEALEPTLVGVRVHCVFPCDPVNEGIGTSARLCGFDYRIRPIEKDVADRCATIAGIIVGFAEVEPNQRPDEVARFRKLFRVIDREVARTADPANAVDQVAFNQSLQLSIFGAIVTKAHCLALPIIVFRHSITDMPWDRTP